MGNGPLDIAGANALPPNRTTRLTADFVSLLHHLLPPCHFAMAAKVITFDELKAHTSKDNLYVLLHGKGALVFPQPISVRALY